jgi:hypothetical protein
VEIVESLVDTHICAECSDLARGFIDFVPFGGSICCRTRVGV